MIPIDLNNQAAENLAWAREVQIPIHLTDNLIGKKIPGSSYFKLKEGDPTKGRCGYVLNAQGRRVYLIEHQPTGSKIRYRKINSLRYGECWEAIPNGE
jgi:hypothetical protein